MNFLVADSGSTKADWLMVNDNQRTLISTEGINMSQQSDAEIQKILNEELIPHLPTDLSQLYFYGAGVTNETAQERLKSMFAMLPLLNVEAHSDLLGCARALFGDEPGIACILGTGTNSGAYDGTEITHNISPGGFIIGDEGSGAYLGSLLCKAYLRQKLSAEVREALESKYGWTKDMLIQKIYRESKPNRFLASLTHIISEFRTESSVAPLIHSAFKTFVEEHLLHYAEAEKMPIGFVGSVAFHFEEELKDALKTHNLNFTKVLQKPIQHLAGYHLNLPA